MELRGALSGALSSLKCRHQMHEEEQKLQRGGCSHPGAHGTSPEKPECGGSRREIRPCPMALV
jgi:hypothetical protein